MNRIYVDAYKQYGLGHLIRTQTIIKQFGRYDTQINKFLPKISNLSIVDSYTARYIDYVNISRLSKISIFLDDFNRIQYPKGILINIAFNAKKIVKQQKTINLLGEKYVPIRKEFLKVIKNPKHILIILGGTDIKNLSYQIEQIEVPYPKLVVTANEKVAKKCKNVLFNPTIDQLAEAFGNSILAISGAGMSLYELNYLQIPTIAIKLAKNQNGVYQFKKRGFIKDIFENSQIDLIKKSIFWHLNNYDLALKYTTQLIDGKGVDRIYKKILEYL